MKLSTTKPKITQNLTVGGLLQGAIDYEIKSGSSNIQWIGPKIPPAVWLQVLAFFKETFDVTHSECQVRLYVNTRTSTWAAWAFPQKARTSMAAEEIADHPLRATQREQFKESEGWVYLGTVHHHCGMTAFQSHTDKQDEVNQDGLHITIGKMNDTQYDMHARFYIAGSEFVPDMSAFWDIGEPAKALVPQYCYDIVARHQMTAPAPQGTAYPVEWKANLVEIKVVGFQNGAASTSAPGGPYTGNQVEYWLPEAKRKEHALAEVRSLCKAKQIEGDEIDRVFIAMNTDDIFLTIRNMASKHRIGVLDILAEWNWEQDMKAQDPAWNMS